MVGRDWVYVYVSRGAWYEAVLPVFRSADRGLTCSPRRVSLVHFVGDTGQVYPMAFSYGVYRVVDGLPDLSPGERSRHDA